MGAGRPRAVPRVADGGHDTPFAQFLHTCPTRKQDRARPVSQPEAFQLGRMAPNRIRDVGVPVQGPAQQVDLSFFGQQRADACLYNRNG
jgi:hypothetical protein